MVAVWFPVAVKLHGGYSAVAVGLQQDFPPLASAA